MAGKKKKTASKKSKSKNPTSTPKPNRSASKSSPKRAQAKNVRAAPTRKTAQKNKSSASRRPSSKSFARVRLRSGRHEGLTGRIVRRDTRMNTLFVALDCFADDPVYSSLEWGPYFEAEVEPIA